MSLINLIAEVMFLVGMIGLGIVLFCNHLAWFCVYLMICAMIIGGK